MSAYAPGQLSPDGSYYWNGQQWVSTLSPDGAHRWDGSAWVPSGPQQPAAATAGHNAAASAARPSTLAWQFGGTAAWSIGFGAAAILVPLLTSLFSTGTVYFLILPLFGFLRGLVAIRTGRVAGGALGIVLNIGGGIMSVLASGLIH